MAKITLDLSQFKASGIYTLEFDASENKVLNTQTVRLIIGFSRRGPFNAPVYLPDKKTAKQVFGDIDTFLERRGSFFHRAIYTCLDVGPIFALNLLPLNDDTDRGDKVPYQSYSLSTTEANGKKVWRLYSSFYNKERFWYPSQDYFLGNVNYAGSINTGKLFNIVNLGQVPLSLIIRKTDMPQFDITAREWYGAGKVPSFINEWDYMSDYFIQLIIVQGNWTDYRQLSIDPIFSEYFDQRGLIKGKLNDFLNAPEVNVAGSFVGSIIPDLIDSNNVTHSIDTVVNSQIAATGLFIALDKQALEEYDVSANYDDYDAVSAVDMVGHNFADPTRENPDIINFLSYKTSIKDMLGFNYTAAFTASPDISNPLPEAWHTESQHLGRFYGYFNNVVCIPKPVTDDPDNDPYLYLYNQYKNLLIPGQSLIKLDSTEPFAGSMAGTYGKIEQIYEEEDTDSGRTYLKLVWSHPNKRFEKPDDYVTGLPISALDDTAGAMTITINASEMTTEQQLFWLPPAMDSDGPWPDVGEDILLENKDTKTWYYVKVREEVTVDEGGTGSYHSDYHHTDDVITIQIEDSDAIALLKKNKTGFKLYAASSANAQLEEGTIVGDDYIVSASPEFIAEPDKFYFVEADSSSADTPNYFLAYKYNKIYEYYEDGALLPGDQLYYAVDKYWYLNYTITQDSDGITVLKIEAYDTYVDGQFGWFTALPDPTVEGPYKFGYNIADDDSIDRDGTSTTTYNMYLYGIADQLYDNIEIINHSWNAYKTSFQVTVANSAYIQVGQYIVSETKDDSGNSYYKLTRVNSKRKIYSAIQDAYVFEYIVNQPIYVTTEDAKTYCTRYLPIDDFVGYYQVFNLDGFKMTDYHLPGGLNKAAQLEKILGVLDSANTNLVQMLKDRDVITFRYVIDTFDGGLAQNTYPKTYITNLAKERQKCMAIMNAPAINEFIDSNDPRFTEEPTLQNPKPVLNTAYIADGGNLTLGPSYTFSLPDETNGAKFAAYYSPFIKLRENGKNIFVPPAAHVSNLYVRKFINGTPFAIVAGTKRGIISDPKLVGLEYEFLVDDRANLEPFGINPIIKKKGMGYVIYANQTAYQRTKTAFNNAHVRDLLITLEEAIEDLLGNYLFEFNNAATRLEIKTKVETYLEGVRSNDGIYEYQVVMDESNNPPEIIDENKAILDVKIEPARGMQIVINRVQVFKTGGIASGGFTIA